jgi:hypothetical protein
MANVIMKPSGFKFLDRLKLGKLLVTEAPQINSSLGIVVILGPEEKSPFELGRIMMRAWLEITECGLAVTPLSSLVDFPETRELIKKQLGPGQRPVGAYRVGKPSVSELYTSPRRPRNKFVLE